MTHVAPAARRLVHPIKNTRRRYEAQIPGATQDRPPAHQD